MADDTPNPAQPLRNADVLQEGRQPTKQNPKPTGPVSIGKPITNSSQGGSKK